jgi:UDP-2,3-diacylglucosamine pyrophosphatase LpxH
MARDGTEVIYIPGNHDAAFREYAGLAFGNLRIVLQSIHTTADHRRFLVLHGDQFDSAVQCGRWTTFFGEIAYEWVLALGHHIHLLRRWLGLSYWSLAAFLKRHVAEAAGYMQRFDEAVVHEAQRSGVDGLICGHIHRPQVTHSKGIVYCNTGDWVENCTALAEHTDGTLELLHWSDSRHALAQVEPRKAA